MKEFLKSLYKKALTRRGIFVLLCLCFIGFLIPTTFAKAGWFSDTLAAVSALPVVFLVFVLRISVSLIGLLMRLSNWILMVAMSNPFPVSLTNPASNPIIDLGWTFLRDLVNMFFILGLAYIGLATALNLSSFNTKKVFSNLLIIALLINFTPVLLGVIVDASNIISNFFLSGTAFDDVVEIFNANKLDFDGLDPRNFQAVTTALIQTLSLAIFGILATVVFLIYAMIFLIRIPILWMLSILSPIAFFAWIFPQTKKYFTQWWDLFIQWATIVVPSAFFIYLSQHTFSQASSLVSINAQGDPTGGIFTQIAPYLIATFFMIIGLMMTMKINAAGSGAIMSVAQNAGAKVKKAQAKIKEKGTDVAKWAAKKPGQAAVFAGAGIGGALIGQKGKGFTKEGREAARKKVHKTAEKYHLRKKGSYEASRKKRWSVDSATQARLEGISSPDITKSMEGFSGLAITEREKKERAAMSAILAKRGKFEFKEDKTEKKFIEEAKTLGVDLSNIKKARPDLTPIIDSDKFEKQTNDLIKDLENKGITVSVTMKETIQEKVRGDLVQKQIQDMGPKSFRDTVTSEKSLSSKYLLAGMDEKKLDDIGERGSIKQRRDIMSNTSSPETFAHEANLVSLEAILIGAGMRAEADEVAKTHKKIRSNIFRIVPDPNFNSA